MLLQWLLLGVRETPPETVLAVLGRISLQGTALIFVLLALRGVFARRVTPTALYALWLLPAVRLLFPGSVGSMFSFLNLLPARPHTAEAMVQAAEEQTVLVTPSTGRAASWEYGADALLPGSAVQDVVIESADTAQDVWGVIPMETYTAGADAFAGTASYGLDALLAVWLLGAAAVLVLALWRNVSFLRRVERDAVELEVDCPLPVYLSESVSSPCLCGLFHPVILISDAVVQSGTDLDMALRHELAHYRAGDRWWALLRLVCCAVHWFNPLVWLAAAVSVQDCERACDWRVLRDAGQEEREAYGMALLRCLRAPEARYSLLCVSSPMGGGKRSLRRRIALIAAGVPVKRTAAAALAACVALTCLVACTGRVDRAPEQEPYQRVIEEVSKIEMVNYWIDGNISGTVSGKNLAGYLTGIDGTASEAEIEGHSLITYAFARDGNDQAYDLAVIQDNLDGAYYIQVIEPGRDSAVYYGITADEAHAILSLGSLPDGIEGDLDFFPDDNNPAVQSIDCAEYPGGKMLMVNSAVSMGRQEHYLFRTEDGGESYTYIPSDLNDVWARVSEEFYFVSADVGFVSFRYEIDDPMLLRTGDGGRTWQRVELPMGGATYDNGYGAIHVTDIDFTDENNGAAVVSLTYKGADLSCMFFTEDGGLTWGAVSTGLPKYVEYEKVES